MLHRLHSHVGSDLLSDVSWTHSIPHGPDPARSVRVQIGIDPPRGVLLWGPPGTGKTMLAKAVAHHTTAAFIRVVGSEFVQKYLGEGPRMVRDVFRLAKENAPAIIFIDEVDAIATARFDAQTGADREVQRILMELLNQMDGFDQTVNVKARHAPWLVSCL